VNFSDVGKLRLDANLARLAATVGTMAEAARRPWSRWRASDTNYGADDGHPLADGTATIVRTPLGSGGGVQVRLAADGQRLREGADALEMEGSVDQRDRRVARPNPCARWPRRVDHRHAEGTLSARRSRPGNHRRRRGGSGSTAGEPPAHPEGERSD
jgi:hypothetical protein